MGIGIKFEFEPTINMRLLHLKFFFLLVVFISFFKIASANDTTFSPVRIAVLAPLNLDSAFNGYEYDLSNTKIQQFFL